MPLIFVVVIVAVYSVIIYAITPYKLQCDSYITTHLIQSMRTEDLLTYDLEKSISSPDDIKINITNISDWGIKDGRRSCTADIEEVVVYHIYTAVLTAHYQFKNTNFDIWFNDSQTKQYIDFQKVK